MDLITFLVFIIILGSIGTIIEKNHYKSIKKREIASFNFPSVSFGKKFPEGSHKIAKSELVSGCVVVGADKFKAFISSLHSLFGGRLTTYESVLDRGRREAILRMKEQATGADLIVNARLETCNLDNIYKNKSGAKISVIAYGTAITYAK